jgi:hypothetical protein
VPSAGCASSPTARGSSKGSISPLTRSSSTGCRSSVSLPCRTAHYSTPSTS